jgi:hypothetical protein
MSAESEAPGRGHGFFLAADDANIFDPSARSALNDQTLALRHRLRSQPVVHRRCTAARDSVTALKGGAHQMAKLVDAYPSLYLSIQRSILADRHLLRMILVRNQDCDSIGKSLSNAAKHISISRPVYRPKYYRVCVVSNKLRPRSEALLVDCFWLWRRQWHR